MLLKDLYEVLASGGRIRIATENGHGWLVDTTLIHLDEWEGFADAIDRKVVNVYMSDGRYCEISSGVKSLERAVCVIVEGNENGTI